MELINQLDETLSFNTQSVRLVGTYEEPWFVAKDICDILTIKDVTMALNKIPEDWKGTKVIGTLGGNQNMRIINESGVYKLIMRSNKEIADTFQKWVCGDVLPSIRKKGEYRMNEEYQLKLHQLEEEKRKLEEEKEEVYSLLEEKDTKIKKLQRETQVVKGKNVVYLATTDEKEAEGVYTVGKAIDLKNRMKHYNNTKLFTFKVVKYISCKSVRIMDSIEILILSKLNKYKIHQNRDVFQLPKDKDVSLFTQWYDYLNKMCEDIEDDLVLEERTEEEEQLLTEEIKEECKEDKSIYNKEYREEHHEEILEREEMYRDLNRGMLRERVNDYRFNNSEVINEKQRIKNSEKTDEDKENKKEYMKIYRKEKAEAIAETKKKYVEEHKEHMEERLKCVCGSVVTRQNMHYHLQTERHKKYLETGKTLDERRKEGYVVCECGAHISKRGVERHKKSKLHISFVESQTKNNLDSDDDIEIEIDSDDDNVEEDNDK
jgi:prophage antirepressor-like protein